MTLAEADYELRLANALTDLRTYGFYVDGHAPGERDAALRRAAGYGRALAPFDPGAWVVALADDTDTVFDVRHRLVGPLTLFVGATSVFDALKAALDAEAITALTEDAGVPSLTLLPEPHPLPTVSSVLSFDSTIAPLRQARVLWSDGSRGVAMSWSADDGLFSEGDLLGKTMIELRRLKRERARHASS